MIRCIFLLVIAFLVFGGATNAADLPSYTPRAKQISLKPAAKTKQVKKVAKLQKIKPSTDPDQKQSLAENDGADQGNEFDLTWKFKPVTANADGGKKEDSGSIEGKLLVKEPGVITNPNMLIEVSGFIVKTVNTTVRVDVKIAGEQYTKNWTADDEASGRFKVTLQAKMPTGKLPKFLPVSAIAFVTNAGEKGVALVSVERINFRVEKLRVAANQ